MAHIFISYSHVDNPFREKLLEVLKKAFPHDEFWWDDEITGGEDWWKRILEEIDKCDLFIFLTSNDWLISQVCQNEWSEAVRLQKQRLPIIVRSKTNIDLAPKKLRLELKRLNWIDLSSDIEDPMAYARVYSAINALTGKSSMQQPASLSSVPTPKPKVSPASDDRLWVKLGVFVALLGVIVTLIAGIFSAGASLAQPFIAATLQNQSASIGSTTFTPLNILNTNAPSSTITGAPPTVALGPLLPITTMSTSVSPASVTVQLFVSSITQNPLSNDIFTVYIDAGLNPTPIDLSHLIFKSFNGSFSLTELFILSGVPLTSVTPPLCLVIYASSTHPLAAQLPTQCNQVQVFVAPGNNFWFVQGVAQTVSVQYGTQNLNFALPNSSTLSTSCQIVVNRCTFSISYPTPTLTNTPNGSNTSSPTSAVSRTQTATQVPVPSGIQVTITATQGSLTILFSGGTQQTIALGKLKLISKRGTRTLDLYFPGLLSASTAPINQCYHIIVDQGIQVTSPPPPIMCARMNQPTVMHVSDADRLWYDPTFAVSLALDIYFEGQVVSSNCQPLATACIFVLP